MTNFKLTLDHLAREWYNQTGKKKTSWESLTTDFSRYFFYSRKVHEKPALPVEQIQVQPSDRQHRGVHQKCSRVRRPASLH